jgi:parvulin-like peptidyl-prolyl isomerase
MEYLLKRISITRDNPLIMLQILANEEIIKQTALQPPYSISISEGDIDRRLEELARDQSEAMDERTYKSWFRQQLDQTRFSADEFRDLIRTNLLTQRLTLYLQERVPTVAEQVHLYIITQNSLAEARALKRRLDAGEDFYSLARELNVDEELRARSGDLGWYPRSGLAENLARAAFDELDIGQASSPLTLSDQLVAIVMVADRVAARQIEGQTVEKLKARVLEEWLLQETRHHKITVHGLKNGFDRETEAWIQWQLQKMRKEQ